MLPIIALFAPQQLAAGAGLRLTQRIGDTSWITRLDVPMYVSDPAWAFSHRQSTFGLNRLVVSLSPVIR